MLKKLKILTAGLLLVCIFLPVSSCNYQMPDPQDPQKRQQHVQYYYVIPPQKAELGVMRYLPAMMFVLPLLLAVSAFFSPRPGLPERFAEIALMCLIFAYIAFYMRFTSIAYGGIVILTAASGHLAFTLVQIFQAIRSRRAFKQVANDHHSD